MNQSSINLQLLLNTSNQQILHHVVDQLFNDYSKLLVVRLDFYLQSSYADINSYEYMNATFAQLRNNLRFNRLFEHYITYAAKLEYGVDRRWHYHVVFFYDGQKVKNDYLLAHALGEYWVETITRGLSSYYSANMNLDKYKAFALGMIDYSEVGRIENLKAVLDYLVKEM